MSSAGFRVCLLCESFLAAGGRAEAQARALAQGLVERGIPTLAVTLQAPPEDPAVESTPGFELHRVTWSSGRWGPLAPLLRKLDELRSRYDLIYVPRFHTLGVPAVVIGRTRGKVVVLKADDRGEISGVPPRTPAGLPAVLAGRASAAGGETAAWTTAIHPLQLSRKAVLRHADHFVATAAELERELAAEGVPRDRVTVIPNGVDVSRFRPAQPAGRARLRERLGLPEHALIACYSGRIWGWKGPLVLLEAWRQIVAIRRESEAALRGPQALLLLLGSGGASRQSCEAEARLFRNENGLEGSVRFPGEVRNVADYLRASDVFALPTWGDAFALALAEAMACGLPSVTTTACAEGNQAVDGENALVVAPGDPGSLRDALLRLLDDAELASRLGRAAAGTASAFSLEHAVDRHVQVFGKLCPETG